MAPNHCKYFACHLFDQCVRLFVILHSSKYAQVECSSVIIPSEWASEKISGKKDEKFTTKNFRKHCDSDLDEHLMDTYSFASIAIEEEKKILDYLSTLSSNSSEIAPSEDFDYYLNTVPSSSSKMNSTEIAANSPEVSTEENIDWTSSELTEPAVSKIILVSHLPATVNNRQLRALFPRCRKIVFKKNYWNKDFGL